MKYMKEFLGLVKDTFRAWQADDAPRLAAGIAYYMALSLAPLLVLVIVLVGLIYNEESVQENIIENVEASVGEGAAQLLESTISSATDFGEGLFPTTIGLVTLVFGAVNVFSQLRSALNVMWNVDEEIDGGVIFFAVDKLLSLGMILVFGLLLLVSLVLSTFLSVIDNAFLDEFPGASLFINVLSLTLSLMLITLLFAMVYKVLPSASIAWRDVWVGAFVTALLFTIGERVLSVYLATSSTSSVYGAAGSFILILLWIYYSAQIILFGAEFTQVYAHRYGTKIEPSTSLTDRIRDAFDRETPPTDEAAATPSEG